jgi:hypothetical protein
MIYFLTLWALAGFANVIQDDVSTTEKLSFSFKEACQKMVSHETPLIEIVSGTELDCMGKKIAVGDFCEKVLAHDPYYLRGYVDRVTEQVVCHSGKKVLFKYQCVKLADKHFCQNTPKNSCELIKSKLAKRLDLVHSSITQNPKGIKELNCYFESLPLKEKSLGSN